MKNARPKGGSKKQANRQQNAPMQNGGMPNIKASQLRQIERQVGQLLSIGTNIQAFVAQFSGQGQQATAAAGAGAGSSGSTANRSTTKKSSTKKTQAAGAQA